MANTKRCVFCEGLGPFHKEDVIPAWAQRAIASLFDDPRVTVVERLPEGERTYVKSSAELATRLPCQRCNNLWMSQMEGRTKPILQPLIIGERSPLTPNQQVALATWAYKTFLAMELKLPKPRAVRDHRYRRFYADHSQPPQACQIWLGAYQTEVLGGEGKHANRYYRSRILRLPPNEYGRFAPDGYLVTFHVYSAVFHLFEHFSGSRASLDPDLGDVPLHQIWPPTGEPIVWPPSYAFTDDTIGVFPTKCLGAGPIAIEDVTNPPIITRTG